MPLPTTTMSASVGRFLVVRWPIRNSLGSLCQNEFVDVGVGRVARSCDILEAVRRLRAEANKDFLKVL